MIATPRSRFLLGSTNTNRACSGESSPRNISGRRWNSVSPRRPPTAKATIIEREEGSMFGGQRPSKKSGILMISHCLLKRRKRVTYWAGLRYIMLREEH